MKYLKNNIINKNIHKIKTNYNNRKKHSFWNSIIGKIIRWIFYIPILIILMHLIQLFCQLPIISIINIFKDISFFGVIKLLFFFSLLSYILPHLFFLYYGVLLIGLSIISPSKKTGIIIFAILNIRNEYLVLFNLFQAEHLSVNYLVSLIIAIIFMALGILMMFWIYINE
ncbi:MAG: hypothetical protein GY817_05000 [bacterium]|nr:hypothetical protein [bacterium]